MNNKKIPQYILDNPEQYIPYGFYCYTVIDTDNETGKIKIEKCPFWDCNDTKPIQEDGYCHYLKLGDWECNNCISLLWDMCKECNINKEE